MSGLYIEIMRTHSRPLEPIPTGQQPVLRKLAGLRAVLFDVYGTLFISGSGEVGTVARQAVGPVSATEAALAEALEAVGIPAAGPLEQGVECFFETIESFHAGARKAAVDYPEVRIVEVWREVLSDLARRGVVDGSACERVELARLAVEYEVRANPCWPMPHLRECLSAFRGGGFLLGIVSNAQFFTPILFEALLGEPVERLGFAEDLQYYSYEYGRAKPGVALFEMAAERLRERGIGPGEVLYVGNDMLNDILPARKVGFHTALFAGDARGLRLRRGDRQLEGVSPDLVLTDLAQLADAL